MRGAFVCPVSEVCRATPFCPYPTPLIGLYALRSLRGAPLHMETSLLAKGKDQGYLLADDIIAAFPNAEEQVESLDGQTQVPRDTEPDVAAPDCR